MGLPMQQANIHATNACSKKHGAQKLTLIDVGVWEDGPGVV